MIKPGGLRLLAALSILLQGAFAPATVAAKQYAPATAADGCVSQGIGVDSFCQLTDININFVDWGGEGPVVILLAGLGASARAFDDFAPRLAGRRHVLALTRRGYGRSSAPADNDYSNAALVGDILGVMDKLSIERASIVGHSIAGGEMATLGADHPERVDRLVYLDSAYDRTLARELMAAAPALPRPEAEDLASLDALARWRAAALGVEPNTVRADLAAIMQTGPDGLRPRTAPSVGQKVLAGDIAAKARWSQIAAPSLAIFSSKDVLDQVPDTASPAQRASFLAFSIKTLRPWMLRAQAQFIEEAHCGVAIEPPKSMHTIFLQRPEWTARTVLSFLGSEAPCVWTSAADSAAHR